MQEAEPVPGAPDSAVYGQNLFKPNGAWPPAAGRPWTADEDR
jgi:hypothetical protein